MNEISEYASKQISSALHLLEQYNSASDEEVLHQLRVSLKKVKAVLDYLRTLHPKKIKSLRKKLQHVFHAAGCVREAQLRLKWLKEKGVNYLIQHAALDEKIKKEEEALFAQKQDHCKKLRTIRDDLEKFLKKVEETVLLEYAFGLKEELAEQIPLIKKRDWHELRKLIKQLLYAQHWVTESHKLKLLSVSYYKQIDQLQETIGVWHDAVDMLLWLTAEELFLSKNGLIKKQFAEVSEHLQKDIEVNEKAVIEQLQTIMKVVN